MSNHWEVTKPIRITCINHPISHIFIIVCYKTLEIASLNCLLFYFFTRSFRCFLTHFKDLIWLNLSEKVQSCCSLAALVVRVHQRWYTVFHTDSKENSVSLDSTCAPIQSNIITNMFWKQAHCGLNHHFSHHKYNFQYIRRNIDGPSDGNLYLSKIE